MKTEERVWKSREKASRRRKEGKFPRKLETGKPRLKRKIEMKNIRNDIVHLLVSS
jgi:hypothetical protein